MKPLFIKKNGTVSKVSGIIMNLIPSYTLAEYNALTHKPLFWVRTDEEYAQIPSTDVSYGSGSVKDALDGVGEQINNIIKAVSYNIPNDTTGYDYNYPSGFNINNCTLLGARCTTKYNSIVDYTYTDFAYWGDFSMRASSFRFQPKVAGNSTSITFVFIKI